MIFRLLDQHGVDPVDFGAWTYPVMVAVLTRGQPEKMAKERWHAKAVLADFAAGKLKWRD